MSKTINVPGRLHSVAIGNILSGANEIYDDSKKKNQQSINTEVSDTLRSIQNNVGDLQSESGLLQQLVQALEDADQGDLATVIRETVELNTKIEQVNRQLDTINAQLNGMSLVVVNEDEYETLTTNDEIDDDTLYFVTEVEVDE